MKEVQVSVEERAQIIVETGQTIPISGPVGATGPQGEKGEKGDAGQNGYTPIKGVDYFDGITGPKGDKGDTFFVTPEWDTIQNRPNLYTKEDTDSIISGISQNINNKADKSTTYTKTEVNGLIEAIPTPDVSGQINTHNLSEVSHADIRQIISTLSNSISGVNTGDETLESILAKIGVSVLSGSNTGDETQNSILAKLGEALTFKNFISTGSSGTTTYTASTKAVPAKSNTKIDFNAEDYDNLNEMDLVNGIWTPSYSQIALIGVRLSYTTSAGSLQFLIRRNDTQAIEGRTFLGSGKVQNATYLIPKVFEAGVSYNFAVRSDVANTLEAYPLMTIFSLCKVV